VGTENKKTNVLSKMVVCPILCLVKFIQMKNYLFIFLKENEKFIKRTENIKINSITISYSQWEKMD